MAYDGRLRRRRHRPQLQARGPAGLPRLYREGLLGGKLAENDTGLDIDDIESAYMKPGNHFWVAETTGRRRSWG